MKKIDTGMIRRAAAAVLAFALGMCPGAEAAAQVAARVSVGTNAGAAPAGPVIRTGTGMQSPMTAPGLGGLTLQKGSLPSLGSVAPETGAAPGQALESRFAARAPSVALALPGSQIKAAPKAAPTARAAADNGGEDLPVLFPTKKRGAASIGRKTVRSEISGIGGAVADMPKVSEVSVSGAHGIGTAVEDMITRSRSRAAAAEVAGRFQPTLTGRLEGLKPARTAVDNGGEDLPVLLPTKKRGTASRANVLDAALRFAKSPLLLPALGITAVIGLLAFQAWLPAAVGAMALLPLAGTLKSGEEFPELKAQAPSREEIDRVSEVIGRLKGEIGGVIIGQQEMVDSIIVAMVAGEHVLLEGVPGVAKTATVRAFADALGVDFQRIQGTPDKMPADIVGAEILQTDPESGRRSLKLEKGPLFARVVLADEINRMMPKTQAAMLEAMQERRVTIGRQSLDLPSPFLLLATQNPIEQEGTYPLPEAQQDRFMYKVIVEQPNREERKKINELNRRGEKPKASQVVTLDDLMAATGIAERVVMSESIRDYIQDIIDAALDPASVGIGEPGLVEQAMITRASIYMEKAARINALKNGRGHVLPEDVKEITPKILRHRIIMSYAAGDTTTDDLIGQILSTVPVPAAK